MSTVSEPMRVAMLAFCDALMASRGPDQVIGPAANPYVHRWHLGPRGDAPNAYIHIFYRDDVDRALHDHRYDNTSIILRNGYVEWSHAKPLSLEPDGRYATVPTLRRQGDVVTREAETPHRVSLVDGHPCTTIFFTGPARRQWGFATPLGWVYWKDFQERIGAVDGNYKGTEES